MKHPNRMKTDNVAKKICGVLKQNKIGNFGNYGFETTKTTISQQTYIN
jgi:spore germination cell wall hydrolase CwlJ-like protein